MAILGSAICEATRSSSVYSRLSGWPQSGLMKPLFHRLMQRGKRSSHRLWIVKTMTTKAKNQTAVTERVIVLDEPTLHFAEGQNAIDPHDGLGLFGPFGTGTSAHPQSPAYIVLGPDEG